MASWAVLEVSWAAFGTSCAVSGPSAVLVQSRGLLGCHGLLGDRQGEKEKIIQHNMDTRIYIYI
eukprot:7983519-Pyramimonas_sp.AAC.1